MRTNICIYRVFFIILWVTLSPKVESQSVTTVAPLQISLSYFGNGCAGGNSIIINSNNGQEDRLSYILIDDKGNEYNDPNQSDTISGLDPGKYYVKLYEEVFFVVSYDNSFRPLRSALDSIVIPATFSINSTLISSANCNPITNGIIDIVITGGISPFILTWSDTLPTQALNSFNHSFQKIGGDYRLSIEDNTGCINHFSLSIPNVSGFETKIHSTNASCGMNNGSLHSFTDGGASPYTFLWSNGFTQPTQTSVPSGNYNLKVTDSNGCQVNQHKTIISFLKRPVISMTALQPSCNNSGIVTANVSGPSTGYSITWHTNPVQTSMTATGLPNRWFPVTITDQFGCQTKNTIPIPAVINPAAQPLTGTPCGQSLGSGQVTPSNGTSPYSVIWSNGLTTNVITGLSSGVYTAVVTDAAGCSAYQALYVQITNVTASINTTPPTESECKNGSATVNCTNCVSPQFNWCQYPVSNTNIYPYKTQDEPVFVNINQGGGCETQVKYTTSTPASGASYNVNTTPTSCNASNGTASLNFVFPQAPSCSVKWHDGQSTVTTNGSASATNLIGGLQSVKVSNGGSCEKHWHYSIPFGSGLNLTTNLQRPICNFPTGILEINPNGGTPPFQYVWNTQPIHTDSIAYLLPQGQYSIQVTDANNCLDNITVNVLDTGACNAIVKGKLFVDLNGNGTYEAGEPGIMSKFVFESNLNSAVFSDGNGDYTLFTPIGTVNIMTPHIPGFVSTLPGSISTITLSGLTVNTVYSGNDFGFMPVSNFKDLEIEKGHIMQPGHIQPYRMYIQVNNKGTQVNNPTLTVNLPPQTVFSSSFPLGGVYNSLSHSVHWNLSSLPPLVSLPSYFVDVTVPTSIPMGSFLSSSGTIDPISIDSIPVNNTDTDTGVVSAPYDPNDIMLIPDYHYGLVSNILISDTILTYRIRFQNTGNDTAFNVTILDTIDPALDLSTLEVILASSPVNVSLEGNNTLRFYFPMIMLPDSSTDFLGSQGMVVYRIKGNSTLNYTVRNSAAIYFDLNAPILTQQSQYTWVDAVSTQENEISSDIKIFPNPTRTRWTLQLGHQANDWRTWRLVDIGGRILENGSILYEEQNKILIPAENLPNGIYFLILESDLQSEYLKLIKN